MELHRDQLQKRCRVCGSRLVAKGKKRRAFYQCSEFKECLFRTFSIDINNDLPDIHPVSLCYSCKQIMDRPMTCYSSTAITEWEVHAEDRCMVSISTQLWVCTTCIMHRYVIPKEVLSQHHQVVQQQLILLLQPSKELHHHTTHLICHLAP